jgi:hypothetical protein
MYYSYSSYIDYLGYMHRDVNNYGDCLLEHLSARSLFLKTEENHATTRHKPGAERYLNSGSVWASSEVGTLQKPPAQTDVNNTLMDDGIAKFLPVIIMNWGLICHCGTTQIRRRIP